jgi:hypothetical protein
MENTLILTHLPNWNRFIEKYQPDTEFIDAFLHRLSLLEDETILEKVTKQINIEIGILLLHDIEIDSTMYALILESIRKN